ncbi:MAG: Phosphatidylinositol kinase [Nocardioidaceae bacterium]|nr:Phosphatidylinositol kinase [Nocardioidaceae bacterium]
MSGSAAAEPQGDLYAGEVVVLGRIMPASNQTCYGELTGTDAPEPPRIVYKPTAGERPLWDFPDGTLAHREYAAWLVSDALGWDVVPPTVLRDGPLGPGMVQLWCEPDAGIEVVDLVAEGTVPPGFRHVLDALDGADRPVSLIHEDSPGLRHMALFDVVVNNTDRKGGHVLAMSDGHRYGVDHGICFHVDDKLRTVLWGFAGEPLTDDELGAVTALVGDLDGQLGEQLSFHLTAQEISRTRRRARQLLQRGVLPGTGGGWPSIPWPPF